MLNTNALATIDLRARRLMGGASALALGALLVASPAMAAAQEADAPIQTQSDAADQDADEVQDIV
ncbi:hypothetical protein LTR94_027039, partial [Friedmanniomyces endolithicus]